MNLTLEEVQARLDEWERENRDVDKKPRKPLTDRRASVVITVPTPCLCPPRGATCNPPMPNKDETVAQLAHRWVSHLGAPCGSPHCWKLSK